MSTPAEWSDSMSTMERIARCGAILGFLFVSSGCVVAPESEHDYGRDRYHDRDHERDRDRDRDQRDHDEHHCGEHDHDDRCRDR